MTNTHWLPVLDCLGGGSVVSTITGVTSTTTHGKSPRQLHVIYQNELSDAKIPYQKFLNAELANEKVIGSNFSWKKFLPF